MIPPLPPIQPISPDAGASSASAAAPSSDGFGGLLGKAVDGLQSDMQQSSAASQQLAAGQATDVNQVVSAVERASLDLQLATQVRNKMVDAYQEIFRMQV